MLSQGESGGPLVVKRNTTDATVVGIVSYGQGCAQPSNVFSFFYNMTQVVN